MTDFSQHDEYELNEKDIDSTLNFLRIFDPKNATPEKAIAFLEYLRIGVHEKAHDNPKELEPLYNEFVKQSQEKPKPAAQ